LGGKILDKLLINRINHHLYKNELFSERQYGFAPQRNTIDAAMAVKSFIQPILENRGLVIMTSLMSKEPLTPHGGQRYCKV
jgi:hypothetical protein